MRTFKYLIFGYQSNKLINREIIQAITLSHKNDYYQKKTKDKNAGKDTERIECFYYIGGNVTQSMPYGKPQTDISKIKSQL